MFYAITFVKHELPVVAYAQWSKDPTYKDCHLWLCCAQDQVDHVLAQPNVEGAIELTALKHDLSHHSSHPIAELHGPTAATLGNFVHDLLEGTAQMSSPNISDLSGFWMPPTNLPPGDGILVWIDPQGKCHVRIVHSKSQARSVIRSLADWMGSARRKRLLQSIDGWNALDTSTDPPYEIEGKAAEVIHWASLLGKARSAMGASS